MKIAPALARIQYAIRNPDGQFAGRYFMISVAGGWFVELVYGLAAEQQVRAGIRTFCLLWFGSAAAFFAGTIGGFLFGVPKSLSNPGTSSQTTNRYKGNTNLEEVSDWLTKIILGLGLVNIDKIVQFIDAIGNAAATAIGPAQGAKLIAISSMVYGFVAAFIIVYVWTRTALQMELERSEQGPPRVYSDSSG